MPSALELLDYSATTWSASSPCVMFRASKQLRHGRIQIDHPTGTPTEIPSIVSSLQSFWKDSDRSKWTVARASAIMSLTRAELQGPVHVRKLTVLVEGGSPGPIARQHVPRDVVQRFPTWPQMSFPTRSSPVMS